jgi:hypothetical protein
MSTALITLLYASMQTGCATGTDEMKSQLAKGARNEPERSFNGMSFFEDEPGDIAQSLALFFISFKKKYQTIFQCGAFNEVSDPIPDATAHLAAIDNCRPPMPGADTEHGEPGLQKSFAP